MLKRVLAQARWLSHYPHDLDYAQYYRDYIQQPKQRLYKLCAVFIFFLTIFYLFFTGIRTYSRWQQTTTVEIETYTETKDLVVVTRSLQTSSWIDDVDPSWNRRFFLVHEDFPGGRDAKLNTTLMVPANKGNEAMRYLSFIIDHYDSLADITVFRHGHNESYDQRADAVSEVNYLNLTTVRRRGYQNFRCDSSFIGCTLTIPLGAMQRAKELPNTELIVGTMQQEVLEGIYDVWPVWFGGPRPEEVGAACCAQFAVTKETVHRRTKEEYQKYRQWLIETPLTDDLSGRVIERVWHVIFGMPVMMCEPQEECICEVYTGPLGCGRY